MMDVKGETYEERLKDAGLELLSKRRRRDMIETFKVMKGIDKVGKEWFEIVGDTQRNTRQNTEVQEGVSERRCGILKVQRTRLDIRKNFFHVRVVNDWNSLPEHVKKAENVNAFKNQYDTYRKKRSVK